MLLCNLVHLIALQFYSSASTLRSSKLDVPPTKNDLVREALKRACESLQKMSLTRHEIAFGLRRLKLAYTTTGVNWEQESTTWILFPAVGKKLPQFRQFVKTEGFGTIFEIVDREMYEIEAELARLELEVPITLKVFHEAYRQVVSQSIH